MKKTILAILATSIVGMAAGQRPLFRKDLGCGPAYNVGKRQNIVGPLAAQAPYNGIVHIGKNGGEDWGTGAFISDSVLITARHVALDLRNLELIQYTATGILDINLNSADYQVIYDKTYRRYINHEIALIKFRKKTQVKAFVHTIFTLRNYTDLWPSIVADVHLTGFPFDKADFNQKRRPFVVDTLADKYVAKDSLQISDDHTMVGYPLFTCSGDSGAPLWAKVENKYYLIGIHYGYATGWVTNLDYNLSTLINQQELDWITRQLQ